MEAINTEALPAQDTVGAVTQLLMDAHAGKANAWDQIYTLLYSDLHRLARSQLWRKSDQTLSPTALVSETWIKLSRAKINAESRRQLVALFVSAMRSVILDEVKRKMTEKRGAGVKVLSLSDGWDSGDADRMEQLVSLDAALTDLSQHMPRLARVVEWRYFGGLSEEEIANLLDVHVRTVRRDWQAARSFLLQRLDMTEAGAP